MTGLKDLRIVVDEREKKSRIPQLLQKVGLDVEIKMLPIGDYIVGPETIVERKSVSDFISSIFDGRLYDQCARLREHYQSPVLIMEGNADEIDLLVDNPMIFYRAASQVSLDFKIPIIPTPNALHTAKLLTILCKKREPAHGPLLKKIKKSTNLQHQQLSVLGSLPGVGEKLAVRMLERFQTPLGVFNATTADLAKVEGLGQARAKKIKAMLQKQIAGSPDVGQKKLNE